MAKMRARRISGSRWVTRSGSRPSGITRASRSAMPSRRSAWASRMTPPSELIRPPSKAAVIFLRRTAGKQNGRRLSSLMAGVARLDPSKGLASATKSYARSNAYDTSDTPKLVCHEYDGLAIARLTKLGLRVGFRRGQRELLSVIWLGSGLIKPACDLLGLQFGWLLPLTLTLGKH